MHKSYLKSIVTIITLAFCLIKVSSAQTNKVQSKEFSYYLLATQWIPGWCKVGTGQSGADLDYARACKSKMWLKHIMYHGLWPQNNDGTYPFDCAKVPLIESSSLSFINPYTNYLTNANSFLDHEWSKHGTCSNYYIDPAKANTKSYYTGLNNYFIHGLKMYAAIKVPTLPAKVTKRNLVKLIHVSNKNIPTLAINIMYSQSSTESKTYLTGLWFCVSKNKYKYIKCPTKPSTKDDNLYLYTH